MTDLWGFCPECQRWFFCEANTSAPLCPVCNNVPSEVKDRSADDPTAERAS